MASKVRQRAEDMEAVISSNPKNKTGALVVAEGKIREMDNAEEIKEEIRISSKTNNFQIMIGVRA